MPTETLSPWAQPAQLPAALDWLKKQNDYVILDVGNEARLTTLQREEMLGNPIDFAPAERVTAVQQLLLVSACYEAGWRPEVSTAALSAALAPLKTEVSGYELRQNPHAMRLIERRIAQEIGQQLLDAGLVHVQLHHSSFSNERGDARMIYQLHLPS